MNDKILMVSVAMLTYNHEKYIAQAIDSVLMQKVNFEFELVIAEDCSTDKTREIVKKYEIKYSDIIRVIYQPKNVGPQINNITLLSNLNGKYVAALEGDDYWTDPYKLQKQVDFLEANPDYGMVHTEFDRFLEDQNIFIRHSNRTTKTTIPSGYIFEKLIIVNCIATLTVMIKRDLLVNAFKDLSNDLKYLQMGDYPLWLYISRKNMIKYLPESSSVYRNHIGSSSKPLEFNKQLNFLNDEFEVKYYFINLLNDDQRRKQILTEVQIEYYLRSFNLSFKNRDYKLCNEFARNIDVNNIKANKTKVLLKILMSKNNTFWRLGLFFYYFLNKVRKYLLFK